MDCVAERIDVRAEFIVDVVGQRHDVERGTDDGKGAGDVDADATRLRIEMNSRRRGPPRLLMPITWPSPTPAADLEPLDGDRRRRRSARIFMPDRHRRRDRLPRRFVPVEDVDVGRRRSTVLSHFTRTSVRAELGERLIGEPRPGSGSFLNEGAHRGSGTISGRRRRQIKTRCAQTTPLGGANTSRSSMSPIPIQLTLSNRCRSWSFRLMVWLRFGRLVDDRGALDTAQSEEQMTFIDLHPIASAWIGENASGLVARLSPPTPRSVSSRAQAQRPNSQRRASPRAPRLRSRSWLSSAQFCTPFRKQPFSARS